MPKISRQEEKLRMEEIRLLMARGLERDAIIKEIGIHTRTLTRYQKLIREETIAAFDGQQIVDLWVAHKKRMEQIITECKEKLESGGDADVSPDKLYRAIQSASESITDMGIKIGIVPPVTQLLTLDVVAKREDENLRELLIGHRTNIENTTATALPAPKTNE